MKVVELRKELKCRNLETTGLKKQLQARLREAMVTVSTLQQAGIAPSHPDSTSTDLPIEAEMFDASVVEEAYAKRANESTEVSDGNGQILEINQEANVPANVPQNPTQIDTKRKDLNMIRQVFPVTLSESSNEAKVGSNLIRAMVASDGVEEEKASDKPKDATSPKKKLEEGASNIKQYWKKLSKPANNTTVTHPINVPLVAQPEPKQKKSPIRMVIKTVQKEIPPEDDVPTHGIAISASNSDLTDDDFDGPISEFSEACAPLVPVQLSKTASVRDLVSKIQNGSSSASVIGGVGESGSALSKNLQAKKEARLARMAEIRGKVRTRKRLYLTHW